MREADDASERVEDDVEMAVLSTQIVGVRYYTGIVSMREQVVLVREPNNPYDANACAVQNVMHTQVGHLPARIMVHLARLMDRGIVRLSGTVSGQRGGFSIPLRLVLYGNRRDVGVISRAVRGMEANTMGSGGRFDATTVMRMVTEEELVAREAERVRREVFDKMVLSISDESIAEAPQPAGIVTPLMAHQLRGLTWLLSREQLSWADEGAKTAFWERVNVQGRQRYENKLTHSIVDTAPKLCLGGVLADDMGMGKTAQVIALISERRRAPNAGATLIIVPAALMTHWKNEVAKHTGDRLQVLIYHGANRARDPAVLHTYDVVVTSYATLASDFKALSTAVPSSQDGKRARPLSSALFDRAWFRYAHAPAPCLLWPLSDERPERAPSVVLDEAHMVKGASTLQARACRQLDATHRWAMTGTPVQNNLTDLGSLVSFLRLAPFDDPAVFNSVIKMPVSKHEKDALLVLRGFFAGFALRRDKSCLKLPPREIVSRTVALHARDAAIYEHLFAMAKREIDRLADANELTSNYARILVMLLRLRQTCCHASLLPADVADAFTKPPAPSTVTVDASQARRVAEALRADEGEVCAICLDKFEGPVVTECFHVFCRSCLEPAIAAIPKCPVCRRDVKLERLFTLTAEDVSALQSSGGGLRVLTADGRLVEPGTVQQQSNESAMSAKFQIMLEEVEDAVASGTKTIVYSQWTSLLELASKVLAGASVKHLRYDGTMSMDERDRVLRAFNDDAATTVLLVSLRAGGVGLNLTVASRVIMLDPWWNEAVEAQAVDRVHRIGQKQRVRVVRIFSANTIEQRILDLQQSKNVLATATAGKVSRDELQRMRSEQVRLLFR